MDRANWNCGDTCSVAVTGRDLACPAKAVVTTENCYFFKFIVFP